MPATVTRILLAAIVTAGLLTSHTARAQSVPFVKAYSSNMVTTWIDKSSIVALPGTVVFVELDTTSNGSLSSAARSVYSCATKKQLQTSWVLGGREDLKPNLQAGLLALAEKAQSPDRRSLDGPRWLAARPEIARLLEQHCKTPTDQGAAPSESPKRLHAWAPLAVNPELSIQIDLGSVRHSGGRRSAWVRFVPIRNEIIVDPSTGKPVEIRGETATRRVRDTSRGESHSLLSIDCRESMVIERSRVAYKPDGHEDLAMSKEGADSPIVPGTMADAAADLLCSLALAAR